MTTRQEHSDTVPAGLRQTVIASRAKDFGSVQVNDEPPAGFDARPHNCHKPVDVLSRTRLGPYEIVATIGAGSMGEVYRATDTNLKRQVAIKVLPDAVAGDAERLVRFQREAEVLALLNHPNIAQIYGLEKSNDVTALVMELVEGLTLADRISAWRHSAPRRLAHREADRATPKSGDPASRDTVAGQRGADCAQRGGVVEHSVRVK